jgi:hypothetical protein
MFAEYERAHRRAEPPRQAPPSGSLASGYAFSTGHGYSVILVTSPFGRSCYAVFGGK